MGNFHDYDASFTRWQVVVFSVKSAKNFKNNPCEFIQMFPHKKSEIHKI